jgi:hypothetical protein
VLFAIFKRLVIRNEAFALSFAKNSGKTALENFEAPKRAFCDITMTRKPNFKWGFDLKRGEITVKDCELRFYTGRTDENVGKLCKFISEDEAQSDPVITTAVYATPPI